MARISTHVLDTSRGKPAEGIRIDLLRSGEVIATAVTNHDGRTDKPLIEQPLIESGEYTLRFHTEGFFPNVAIAFVVKNGYENYHIPLLLSPFGYSTYRGS